MFEREREEVERGERVVSHPRQKQSNRDRSEETQRERQGT
jgi:hypothetical protein